MPGPIPHTRGKQKPQNPGKTLRRILGYAADYRGRLILVVFCILISSLAGVAGNYFIKPFINQYIVPFIGQQNVDLSGFIRLILLMSGIFGLGIVTTYIYQYNMMQISTGILRQVRVDMFEHMMQLPLHYFDTHNKGEIMSRYSNDTDTLREMISQSLPQLFSSVLTVVSVFIMMLILSPLLTLIVVAVLGLMLLVVRKVGGKSAGYFVRQQKELGGLNGYIEEMTAGVKVVKVFCHEPESKAAFDEKNDALFEAAKSANTFANILMPIMGNLSNLLYAAIAMLGALLCIRGGMDLGTIGSFLQYTRNFSQPVTQISQQINNVLAALAGAERIFQLLDEAPEADAGEITLVNVKSHDGQMQECEACTRKWAWKEPSGKLTPLVGFVELHNVDFSYEPGKQVLRNVSLYAKQAQKIAFVGSTGAGKTTITNLINRFYDVDAGSITYDGFDVRRIKKQDLRRAMAVVLQETHLFTGTVLENIRYGRLEATDEECIYAARLANADSFIRHLPKGYQTVLTEDGANLSQGQRQLLSIARALVNAPPVLVLDEATSSIDTRTEALIEKGLDTLMEGRTTFVIAHRLSTVRNANAIMVLEHGEIIERGDHEDLLLQKGKYYQLYTGAFELE